jgi:small redox-active disulfide protein 2
MESIADTHADETDDEIERVLMEALSAKNYIPTSAKAQYGKAFVREFKKFTGRPYEESRDAGLKIVLVGPGCFQCSQLEQTIIQVLTEMALPASFEHVTDLKEITKLGIMQTPTLIINDKVVAKGVVPTAKKIKAWLIERTKT